MIGVRNSTLSAWERDVITHNSLMESAVITHRIYVLLLLLLLLFLILVLLLYCLLLLTVCKYIK